MIFSCPLNAALLLRARRAPAALHLAVTFMLMPAAVAFAAQPTAEPQAGAIRIEADQMQYDDKARVNVFNGNVVLTRGDIQIRASRLRLSQDAAGNQIARATGKPAHFVQNRTGEKMTVEGEGRELRYSSKTEAIEIIGAATLLRSRPGQAPDRVTGARIVYQSNNDFFTVEGGEGGTSESNPKGRVQVVIQPRSDKKPTGSANTTSLKPAKSLKAPAKSQ